MKKKVDVRVGHFLLHEKRRLIKWRFGKICKKNSTLMVIFVLAENNKLLISECKFEVFIERNAKKYVSSNPKKQVIAFCELKVVGALFFLDKMLLLREHIDFIMLKLNHRFSSGFP